LDFFLVILKLQGGPKSDEFLAYFQTSPANFLLSRPNAAEYCNSEKKTLLSTDGCSTRVPGLVNFALQTLTSTRHIIVFFQIWPDMGE